jgi:hypothetical protein
VSFNLTNTSLTGVGTDTLSAIENALLTGGASANTFTVSGWTGGGSLTGGGGTDTVVASKNVSFTLSNSSLSATNGLSMSLSGIGIANLTGGAAANTFTVSGWTGTGTLTGSGGTDVVASTNDANFTLTNTSLSVSGGASFVLATMEQANLTGGLGANTFTVSGWTGTAADAGRNGDGKGAATGDDRDSSGSSGCGSRSRIVATGQRIRYPHDS